jgi:hypothetical protein
VRERERERFSKTTLVWGKETAAAGDPKKTIARARDKTQKSSRRRSLFEKREVAEEEEDAREERWVDRPRNPRS